MGLNMFSLNCFGYKKKLKINKRYVFFCTVRWRELKSVRDIDLVKYSKIFLYRLASSWLKNIANMHDTRNNEITRAKFHSGRVSLWALLLLLFGVLPTQWIHRSDFADEIFFQLGITWLRFLLEIFLPQVSCIIRFFQTNSPATEL